MAARPPARRARLGCDCSSLSPLTLKPLRSPTPCPFTAIATAFNVRLRRTRGSAVASDAFCPFADGLLAAAEAGATAVIQPGGSIRDDEVIAAADAAGLAMVFTGMRHFRH